MMKSDDNQISLHDTGKNDGFFVLTNENQKFIDSNKHPGPAVFHPEAYLPLSPLPVIDEASLKLIELFRLHKAIDRTDSATGSAVLLRAMIQPSKDLNHIRAKQEALREIAVNDRLRRVLADYVHEFSKGESALYKFFNKGLYALFPYPDLKTARRSAAHITTTLPTIPQAESLFLKRLISNLYAYKGSSIDQMLCGSIYKTFSGLKPQQSVAFWTPKFKFFPGRFTKWLFAGPAIAGYPYIHRLMEFEPAVSPLMSIIGLVGTAAYGFYSLAIKPVRDTGNYIEPLRKNVIHDATFGQAIDAIGMIDTLLSYHRFSGGTSHATVLPKVADETNHFFEADGLRNPIAAQDKPDFVSNSVSLKKTHLTFLTGPNSGGKTTLCKSIIHNQLLAQMGSYVMAEKATINIADLIRYQAPQFDGLQDAEGRFGTELSRTRDIFYATTPKSLVILDELAEGTTYEEQLDLSFGILRDFYGIGNNTVLVTHNHSLAEKFKSAQQGQHLQVEFKDESPTYSIIPGISKVSHAEQVAQRINFSSEDRRRHMAAKGYI